MPYTISNKEGQLVVHLHGDWSKQEQLTHFDADALSTENVAALRFDSRNLGSWDSALLVFLLGIERWTAQQKITFDLESLPQQLRDLLKLALEIPQRQGMAKPIADTSLSHRVGTAVLGYWHSSLKAVDFLGELCIGVSDLLRSRCHFRKADFLEFLNDCGPRALGINSLISFLIGMILAFVGAMQLEKFGAGIYVASLVGISMVREMAPMMTGIIMAGRTGASYAAQLGSMQVNEEIDALRTLGVSPFNYLVMPRLLALTLMMPLLNLYANLVGILGGAVVSALMLGLPLQLYFNKLTSSLPLYYFGIGLLKSLVFGILVALSGCYMGMQSGRSATAVGQATTSAVVTAIVLIIVADSIFTIVTTLMKV